MAALIATMFTIEELKQIYHSSLCSYVLWKAT